MYFMLESSKCFSYPRFSTNLPPLLICTSNSWSLSVFPSEFNHIATFLTVMERLLPPGLQRGYCLSIIKCQIIDINFTVVSSN